MIEVFYAWTQIFLIICSACAVYLGFSQKAKHSEMRLFLYYSVTSLIETICSPIIDFEIPYLKVLGLSKMLGNVFLFIEVIVIYNYFLVVLINKKNRNMLRFIGACYVGAMVYTWVFEQKFNKDPDMFFVPQAIFILYPAFCHIIELIKFPRKVELVSEPSFWITTGIMLYFGCTLPLFLLADIFDFSKSIEKSIFSINFICYGTLFIFIIKAYLCKQKRALS